MPHRYTEHQWQHGSQRLYSLPNGYFLSAINCPSLLCCQHAWWEIAILNPQGHIDYTTPLTIDVERFSTDSEAEAFIDAAFSWAAPTIGGMNACP